MNCPYHENYKNDCIYCQSQRIQEHDKKSVFEDEIEKEVDDV